MRFKAVEHYPGASLNIRFNQSISDGEFNNFVNYQAGPPDPSVRGAAEKNKPL